MAEVVLLPEALEDILALEGSMRARVMAKVWKLRESPELGQPLGSKVTTNLTMFRKLVVGDRTMRVIYRVDPDGQLVVVWVVAGRSDSECYDIAAARLAAQVGQPELVDFADLLRRLKPSS